jgi:hypothetical protein
MKRQNYIRIALLFISTTLMGQIGIGTTTPARALEVYSATGVPPLRFPNLTSNSANVNNTDVKSLVVDSNGDLYVGRPKGSLLATMVSSLNVDLNIGETPLVIPYDTDDLAATGTISRSGGVFTILSNGDGLYTFALQPQITTNTPSGYVTFWAVLNGTTIANTGVRNSSTGTGDTQVVPLIITLYLVAGDQVSFKAVCTQEYKYKFEYTAAAGVVPAIPAVIMDVKGYNVF